MQSTHLLKITNLTPLYAGGIVADPIVDKTIQKNSINKEPLIHSSSLKGSLRGNFVNNFDQYISNTNSSNTNSILFTLYTLGLAENNLKNIFINFIFGNDKSSSSSNDQIGFVNFFDSYFLKGFNSYSKDTSNIKNLISLTNTNYNILNSVSNTKNNNPTEIRTHIAIDYNTGLAKNGALWNQEYVVPNTHFISLIMFNDFLDINNNLDKNLQFTQNKLIIKKLFKDLFYTILINNYFQIGGSETHGCGFCQIQVIKESDVV